MLGERCEIHFSTSFQIFISSLFTYWFQSAFWSVQHLQWSVMRDLFFHTYRTAYSNPKLDFYRADLCVCTSLWLPFIVTGKKDRFCYGMFHMTYFKCLPQCEITLAPRCPERHLDWCKGKYLYRQLTVPKSVQTWNRLIWRHQNWVIKQNSIRTKRRS